MDIDIPAPGDFNGNGRTDFAGVKNFQSSLLPMIWRIKYNLRNGQGVTYETTWGTSFKFGIFLKKHLSQKIFGLNKESNFFYHANIVQIDNERYSRAGLSFDPKKSNRMTI